MLFVLKESWEIIEGSKAFNSGALTLNHNFLNTFEEEGVYCVASFGAPDFYCLLNVLERATKADSPTLVNREPYLIDKYHKIHLNCKTIGAKIYYTTNGTQPNGQSPYLRVIK